MKNRGFLAFFRGGDQERPPEPNPEPQHEAIMEEEEREQAILKLQRLQKELEREARMKKSTTIRSSRPIPDRFAFILNQASFDPRLEMNPRQGTDKDRDYLATLLKSDGFQIRLCNDFTLKEIDDEIEEFCHHCQDIRVQCIFVAILTHGDHHKLYAYDQTFMLKEIQTRFASVTEGPKFYVVQVKKLFIWKTFDIV